MFQIYTAIFILFLACDFTLVKSQAPVLQACSFSGGSSSPVEKISGISQPHFPTISDPNKELFSYSIANALLYSDVLKNFVDFEVCKPYQIFYTVSLQILQTHSYLNPRDGVLNPCLAIEAAEAGDNVGLLNFYQYFNSMGNMLAKFFSNNGILTVDKTFTYAQQIRRSVEDYAIANGVFDTESLVMATGNGFYNFLKGLGLNNSQNIAQLFHLFAQEMQSLPRRNCNS